MRETFVTSFKLPAFIQVIARLLGYRIISQDGLGDDGWKALSSVDMSIWAAAQREFRTAILALRDGEDCGRMSACRVIGLTEKTCQLALAQFLSRSTLAHVFRSSSFS